MPLSETSSPHPRRWTSLWVVAFLSLMAQLALCQFFTFGREVPYTIDMNPSNLWKFAYHFPPEASFRVLNWLGEPYLPPALSPSSLAANLAPWLYFTAYAPVMATLGLLAMVAFLRELGVPRPAAIFGGLIYAWQGDILPFVFPAHFGYITTWPFFALAAWGALRAQRTRHWAYAVISGACCGLMVALPSTTDRGAIASLLIAALYVTPVAGWPATREAWLDYAGQLRRLALCVGVALLISIASFLALFQCNITGVKLGGQGQRAQTYKFCTQFSLGPAETLTYLVPGFFGWHSNDLEGPYWGWIGQWPDWPKKHEGMRNLNLAISTTGTVATVLALIGLVVLLPGRWLGPDTLTSRQRVYGRLLLTFGGVGLVLAWGYHTPYYHALFTLPLMDKWRNPLKWLEWTNFALVTLSALGAQHLLTSLEAGTRLVRHRLFWFGNGMLMALIVALIACYPFTAFALPKALRESGYTPDQIGVITANLLLAQWIAVVSMALFCCLLYGLWRPEALRRCTLINPFLHRLWQAMLQPEALPLTLALGLAALGVTQLGWVATQFLQPTELQLITASNPLVDALASEGNTVRVSVATEDPLLSALLLNQFNAKDISSLDISAASRIPDDLGAFLNALKDHQQRLWFLTGVKNVAIPQESLSHLRANPEIAANIDHVDGCTLVPTSSPDLLSHAIVTLRDYLAKATLVPYAEILPTDQDVLKRLKDPAWNPRNSVLLTPYESGQQPPAIKPEGEANNPAGPAEVHLVSYTPHDIKVEVQSTKGGYLLINDQYDPDWQAQVNGSDAALLRADYILRAIQIPPGACSVTLHYVAHYHLGSLNLPVAVVNTFSDAALLAAWIIAGFALRRSPEIQLPA